MNQLLWRLSYLSSCLSKRLQAFWISGCPTNPSHFLASYRLHQARVGLPYEALVTFSICFFYWFFQLRLPNLHSRYKAETSTLIYLGRSTTHWQKEEANRNLLSIHLKITLLLLLLTPFDSLMLCLCLLRHCSLCVRPAIIPELIANDVRLLLSLFFNTQPRTNNCSLSFGLVTVIWPGEISATYFVMFRYILGERSNFDCAVWMSDQITRSSEYLVGNSRRT